MLVRFHGGPNHGQDMEVPDGMDPIKVALPRVPTWDDLNTFGRSLVEIGLYKRDGLPNVEPYIYSWKGIVR